MIFLKMILALSAFPVMLAVPRTIVRIVRSFHRFPIPGFLADLTDHPSSPAYMIAVIGEISEPVRAMHECHRVLSPAGRLIFSELLLDPDYSLAGSLERLAAW